MSRGIPPDAQSPDDLEVEAARGSVRDILGSLRNLEQLLKSIRVGPRALTNVIPDVHASLGPLLRHTHLLAGAVRTGDARCKDAIMGFIEPRIIEAERSLAQVKRGPLRASQRLELEQVITRVGGELHVALGLLDLLIDAREQRTVPLDVMELARESASFFRPMASGIRSIPATLAAPSSPLSVQVAPRTTLGLLAIAVSLGVQQAAHITVEPDDGGALFRIVEGRGEGEPLDFVAPIAIEPTRGCGPILATAAQGRFERDESGARVWLPGPDGFA